MFRLRLLIAGFALAAAACGSDTPTTPTPVTPVTVTDTFAGPLNRNGGQTHQFATASSGAVQALVTALSPDNTIVIGLSLGTWNGASCNILLVNDKATQASSLFGQASGTGNLCVRVYDVGNITDPISYEIQVTHP